MNISLDKKYKDGYGRAVRILEIDTEISDEYPVRGELLSPSGKGTPRSWTADGRWRNDGEPRKDDLVEVVESPEPEPKAPAPVATAPKWEIGPVKLVNETEAIIDAINENQEDFRYVGRQRLGSTWMPAGWHACGRMMYATKGTGLDLAPPPKKTVRVRRWINVDFDGESQVWTTKEFARRNRSDDFMALLVIDKVVTEGDGL